ncbi:WYL domain-containing protein [Spectribacter hydrogenoxidans]|uniref:WYL domain-containing protein n=1 Tax=Spectribacter hydrogenoxidans TaxID=3075608 RepID=A0ABU3BZY1_9GAMM|nr:WYL domain-containing protein [Salinisphaera sp. W335]MDT0634877.1 WYL domain-containing protein [Salinisphaera sp. W335]
MAEKTDQTYRQWLLLRAIPRAPRRLSTRELHQRLIDEGYEISLRSVQRDLQSLSIQFGFVDDIEGRTSHWFWPEGFRVLDVPGLDPSTALVFLMARRHLGDALPPSILDQLSPYFDQAEQVLGQASPSGLASWSKHVRLLRRGPGLMKPEVSAVVLTALEQALLQQRTLQMRYRRRGADHVQLHDIDPRGLVIKNGVTYLVGTYGTQLPPYHFAAHRIESAEISHDPSPALPAFDLDRYLHSQRAFDYPHQDERLELVLKVTREVSEHLDERPLCDDQQIESVEDDQFLVRATVPDTAELRWWILGHGASVTVVEPGRLRSQVAAEIEQAASNYVVT